MKSTHVKLAAAFSPLLVLLACTQPGSNGSAVLQVLQGATAITSGGSYGFGNVAIGASSAPVTFTIKNTGTAPASLSQSSALSISGNNTADFAVSTQPSQTIAAGDSTTFALKFSPSTVAAESVSLSISSAIGTYTFSLSGTGAYSGTLSLAYYNGEGYSSIADGDTVSMTDLFGSGSTSKTIQISNTDSSEDLELVGATPVTITNSSGAFSIGSYPTSPVAPNGGTTFFEIDEIFTAPGISVETVTLKTSDPTYPTFTFSVSGFHC